MSIDEKEQHEREEDERTMRILRGSPLNQTRRACGRWAAVIAARDAAEADNVKLQAIVQSLSASVRRAEGEIDRLSTIIAHDREQADLWAADMAADAKLREDIDSLSATDREYVSQLAQKRREQAQALTILSSEPT